MAMLSRRRRTYNRVPNTDYEYLDFLVLARNADFRKISEISKTDRCWLAAKEYRPTTPEATIGYGVAPGMVSKDLVVIGGVRLVFTGRNWSYMVGNFLNFRFWSILTGMDA